MRQCVLKRKTNVLWNKTKWKLSLIKKKSWILSKKNEVDDDDDDEYFEYAWGTLTS